MSPQYRVLDSRPRDHRFEPHRRHCVVSLSKNINPSLVLVLPRKTRPFISGRLLMGRKESNQRKQIKHNGSSRLNCIKHFMVTGDVDIPCAQCPTVTLEERSKRRNFGRITPNFGLFQWIRRHFWCFD